MLSRFHTLKSALCALILTSTSLSSYAALEGDGYYRVENFKSHRYIYVLDNKGELNFQATTADLGALELWLGYDRTVSDPATVIYMMDIDGRQRDYDFMAQGTGVMSMINHAVSVMLASKADGTYRIFGRDSGAAKYIGDGAEYEGEKGRVGSSQPASSEWVRWYIHPITGDDNSYFGLTPDITTDNGNYTSLYASFPFSTASEGMTVYCVTRIEGDVAIIKEVKGTVAGATPVIVKVSGATPALNKLNLGGNGTTPSGNMLKGVYFKNETISHHNVTPYDSRTMRLLGKNADGKAAFVTTADTYLPRNKAYLPVPEGTPAELRIMTEEEYAASVDRIESGSVSIRIAGRTLHIDGLTAGTTVDVCNITGQTVYSGTASAISLPAPGIYIARIAGRAHKFIAR